MSTIRRKHSASFRAKVALVALKGEETVVELYKHDGRRERGVDVIERRGYNFRITELQAALGVAQFPKLREVIRLKRRNEELYRQGLMGVEPVTFPHRDPRCSVVPHRVNVLVEEPQRLIDYLGQHGIGCRRFYIPMHRQPCYNYPGQFPNSEWAYEHGVVLPSSPTLTEQQIATVCERIKAFYG